MMEVTGGESNSLIVTRKRAREDDSTELDSVLPESKRVNENHDGCTDKGSADQDEFGRVESEANLVDSARCDSPVSEICQLDSEENSVGSNEGSATSPDVMKFREDILDILDEAETVPDAQDLDSVIRSFEEEILQLSPSLSHRTDGEMTSYPGEAQPDLGYLLEASDDELGLPPTVAASSGDQTGNGPLNPSLSNEGVVVDDGLGGMVGFEDQLPCYGSYEFGMEDGITEGQNYAGNGNGDFVTVDGLFDYADGSDFSDLAWRPESLPAL